MNKNDNKNYLKKEQYDKMGNELSEIVRDLQLMQKSIDFTREPNDPSVQEYPSFYYYQTFELMNILFYKLQDMEEKIDLIGAILFNIDDIEELQAFVSNENIINDPTDDTPAKK